MAVKKIRLIAFIVMTFMAAGWVQPALAHMRCSAFMENDGGFSVGLSGYGADNDCPFMQTTDSRPAMDSHDASGHDPSSHMPTGKACAMKVCAPLYAPVMVGPAEIFTAAPETERIAFSGDVSVPSSHLGGLFRPPRSNATLWG